MTYNHKTTDIRMTPTVRRATTADFPAIQGVIEQFPDHLMQTHLPEPEEFFVAEDDGAVVGCCALEIYSQRLAEVRSLAVLESHRGQGIAAQLVDACLAEATARGIYEVLAITGTPAFFEKHAFSAFKSEKFALLKVLG